VSAQSGATSAPIRFGVFAFDVLSSELRRDGVRVTIGEQPTQVLRLLLERHGELVTREDLRATLWPDQTFIDDFDQGLNAAVKRLRDLLGDKADDPQLIETVPRRGYRFIGRVDEPEAVRAPPISSSSEPGPRRWTRSRALWVGGCTAVVILAGAVAVMWMPLRSTSPPAAPATPPARVVALTTLPGVESFAAFSPDGNAIAFTWNGEKGDNFDVYVKDIGSSQVRRLTKDPGRDVSPVWSPDGRQIAFVRFDGVAGRLHITSALTLGNQSERPSAGPRQTQVHAVVQEHRLVSGRALHRRTIPTVGWRFPAAERRNLLGPRRWERRTPGHASPNASCRQLPCIFSRQAPPGVCQLHVFRGWPL
jgi:DNA-binding winged helix-turn-helix (wHTH) protein